MKNYIVLAISNSPTGPQIAQTGRIIGLLGDCAEVEFDRPAAYTRFVPAIELAQFHLFASNEQAQHFLNAINPPAPAIESTASPQADAIVPGTTDASA